MNGSGGNKRAEKVDFVPKVMRSHRGYVRRRGTWSDPMMERSLWTSMRAILEAEAEI